MPKKSKNSEIPNQSKGPIAAPMVPREIAQDLDLENVAMVATVNRRMRDMLANRHNLEVRWDEYTNQFLMTEQAGKEDWQAKGQSALLYGVVEGVLAEILDSEPVAQIVPLFEETKDAPLKQLDQLIHIPLRERRNYIELVQSYKDCLIFGTGFVKVGYNREERPYKFMVDDGVDKDGAPKQKYVEEVVTVADEITLRRVAINRFMFDPYATSIEDAEDAMEMAWFGFEDFKKKFEGRQFFFDVDKVTPTTRTGVTPAYGAGTTEPYLQRFLIPGLKQYVRVIEYWNKTTDTYAVVANGRLIRNTPIPYNDKKLPYTNFRFGIVPDRLYGLGLSDVLRSSQEHISSMVRLGIDAAKLASSSPMVASTQLGLDDDQLGTLRPDRIISVEGDVGQFQKLNMPDISPSLKLMQDVLHEEARMGSGFDTRLMQGQNGATTAFEFGLRQESQMKRLAIVVRIMEVDGMVPLLERVWSRLQQFYTEEKVYRGFNTVTREPVKVLGYPTLLYQDTTGKNDWKKIAITQELAQWMKMGDYKVVLRSGAQIGKSKTLERSQAMEAFNFFGKVLTDPTAQPGEDPRVISLHRLVEETAPKLGVDYDKIKPATPYSPPTPPPPEPPKFSGSVRADVSKMPPDIQEKFMEKVLSQQLSPQDFQGGMPQGGAPGPMAGPQMAPGEAPMPGQMSDNQPQSQSAPSPIVDAQALKSRQGLQTGNPIQGVQG